MTASARRHIRSHLLALAAILASGAWVACAPERAGDRSVRTAADVGGGVRFRDRTADVAGTRLHFVIGGRGSPVLLVAGFPETWYAWRKVMPALASHHTVIAVDPPGVGGSSMSRSGYDARSVAGQLASLSRQLKLGPMAVVGHDLGGWVAYALARFHPRQVRRLAILDAGVPGFGLERRLDFSAPGRGSLRHVVFFMQQAVPEQLLAGKEREFITGFLGVRSARPGTFDGGAVDEYVHAYSRPGRLTAALGPYRAFYRDLADNRSAGAPMLALPLLVLGGSRGGGRADVEDVRRAARNVRARIVPDAGHFVMEERPDYVSMQLLRFLG